jgi:hypothetical protein
MGIRPDKNLISNKLTGSKSQAEPKNIYHLITQQLLFVFEYNKL